MAVGDLVTRLTGDIDALNALLSSSAVLILSETVTLITIVITMFGVNWRLALLALAVLPVLAMVTRYFRRRIRGSSSRAHHAGAYQQLSERAAQRHAAGAAVRAPGRERARVRTAQRGAIARR